MMESDKSVVTGLDVMIFRRVPKKNAVKQHTKKHGKKTFEQHAIKHVKQYAKKTRGACAPRVIVLLRHRRLAKSV
jgi:hypothetical protein